MRMAHSFSRRASRVGGYSNKPEPALQYPLEGERPASDSAVRAPHSRASFLSLLLLSFIIYHLSFPPSAQAQTTTNNVTLAWNPVPNVTNVTYAIGFGTNSGNYTSTNSTAASAITITNLTSGLTYYFAVQASAPDYASSPWSAEVTATVSKLPAPAGVHVTSVLITP
jgi:hypothetical protein